MRQVEGRPRHSVRAVARNIPRRAGTTRLTEAEMFI